MVWMVSGQYLQMPQFHTRKRTNSMRNVLHILGLAFICLVFRQVSAEDALPVSSLCDLQAQSTRGDHRTVSLEGIYLAGLEGEYLVSADCSERSTRVEFALKSKRNWETLRRMVNEPYRGKTKISGPGKPVLVIFNGEFYGPPVPDPNLPERIRNVYRPGWDNVAMTKLIVHSIESVGPVPSDNPCAPPKSTPTQWPCFHGARAPQ
jgi:hypothetical protein